MKKTLSNLLIGTTLLVIPNVMLTAQTLSESVFEALDIKVSGSQIETYYKSFIPTQKETDAINPDNLASIFEVYSYTQTYLSENLDDLTTGGANLEYAKKVASMEKLVRDGNDLIDAVDENFSKYTTADTDIDNVLKEYLDYQKAVTKLLELESKEYRAKLLKDVTVTPAEIVKAKEVVESKKKTFSASLDAIPESKKTSTLNALKDLHADLKVTKPKFQDSDVIPAQGCETDCEKKAQVFLKNVIGKGEQPSYGTIYVKGKKSCAMDKVMKSLSVAFNLGQLLCDRQVRKNGMVKGDGSPNTGSLACLSAYKHLGNTKDNYLLNPYINRLDNVNAINLSLLTKGAGTNASLGTGGSTPSNVFSTGTGTTTTNTETGTNVTTSSVSPSGDGVTRFNANTAVTSFYNPSVNTYQDMTVSANSFVNSVKPINTTISNYNEALTSAMVGSNPKIAKLPETEEKWALSTLNATTSTTPSQQTDALRLEFSRQQAQMQAIISQLDVTQKKLGTAKFMALYGSQTQSEIAMQEVASYTVSLKMLQSQGIYAQTRLGLLTASLGLGRYRYGNTFTKVYKEIFNINYMYASNENKNMPKALKLSDIKTPITLKKGWENDFRKYIEEMAQRSTEAKKAMNEAKIRIKELLAERLPTISLEKLPQQGEIRDELINMQSIKKASLKNLGVINNAMAYHNKRKDAYSSSQYTTFKQEEETVGGSMRRTISSINAAEKPVSDAYDVVSSLYQEIPRTEALRVVAKRMVAEGR